MSIQPDATVFAGLVGSDSRTFLAYGASADVDEAFDDASRRAQDCAPDSAEAWLASADASDVQAMGKDPLSPDAALSWAVSQLLDGEIEAGSITAVPVAAANAFKRSKVRIVLDDPSVEMPDAGSVLLPGDSRWEQAYAALVHLAEQSGMSPDAQVARIEIAAVRRRFKPAVTVNRSASAASFALMEGERVIQRGYRTAGEARRAAVDMLKAMSADEAQQRQLDVVKIAAREDGPLLEVRRELTAQKARAVVHVLEAKASAGKTAGWLMLGRIARSQ